MVEHFKKKTVLCNCDDPKVSNFFHEARSALVEGFQTEADLARIYRETVADAVEGESMRHACLAALWPGAIDAAVIAMCLAQIPDNQRVLVRQLACSHVHQWFENAGGRKAAPNATA